MLQIKALKATDMCKGRYHIRNKNEVIVKSCLTGHIGLMPFEHHGKMYSMLLDYINTQHPTTMLFGQTSDGKQPYSCIHIFNDSHTHEENARMWNECFAQEIG